MIAVHIQNASGSMTMGDLFFSCMIFFVWPCKFFAIHSSPITSTEHNTIQSTVWPQQCQYPAAVGPSSGQWRDCGRQLHHHCTGTAIQELISNGTTATVTVVYNEIYTVNIRARNCAGSSGRATVSIFEGKGKLKLLLQNNIFWF